MIPNPIRKALSSMRTRHVRALLMGGQACAFYGAAEFSRDTDLASLADAANLARLRRALAELEATLVAVPPFALKHLRRGPALHFRCQHPEALRMRVDVMARMRGVDAFPKLWLRRTTIELPDGTRCDLRSLPDLVQAKKTQQDKDWPMIRRLVEAHYFQNQKRPNPAQVRFWLIELRTPQLLSAGTMQSKGWGAQPPRLRFGAPSRRTRARSSSPNGAVRRTAPANREGAVSCARGGRAPQFQMHCPGSEVAKETLIKSRRLWILTDGEAWSF